MFVHQEGLNIIFDPNGNSIRLHEQNIEKDRNEKIKKLYFKIIIFKNHHHKKPNNERDSAGFFVIETCTTIRVQANGNFFLFSL